MRGASIGIALLLSASAASADWTVRERLPLPRSGAPLELASLADPHEDTVRIALVGSYSFLHDGSEIDAMSATVGGTRDVSLGPIVALPPGSRVIESDPLAHRYVVEIPRAPSMPLALNLYGLSTRHLITVSEVNASLRGAIEVEHLVPPPPPPSATQRAVGVASAQAAAIGPLGWAGGASLVLVLGALGLVAARRRRDPIAARMRRAARAHRAIAREVIAIGPAFDPVAASSERLVEACAQQARHVRSLDAALARTAWTGSAEAQARRAELARRRDEAVDRLEELVARLEGTATELAGRAADESRAAGVDRLVATMGADLDAAVQAEAELFS